METAVSNDRFSFDSQDDWIGHVADDTDIIKKSWTTSHLESALSEEPAPPPPPPPADNSDD
jgi:hypothetical protein